MVYYGSFSGDIRVLRAVEVMGIGFSDTQKLMPHVLEDAGIGEDDDDHGEDAVDGEGDEDEANPAMVDRQGVRRPVVTFTYHGTGLCNHGIVKHCNQAVVKSLQSST